MESTRQEDDTNTDKFIRDLILPVTKLRLELESSELPNPATVAVAVVVAAGGSDTVKVVDCSHQLNPELLPLPPMMMTMIARDDPDPLLGSVVSDGSSVPAQVPASRLQYLTQLLYTHVVVVLMC